MASVARVALGTSGVYMPAIGYGVGTTWFKSGETGKQAALKVAVKQALDAGFTHIDDAEMYENAAVTGAAIREWLAAGSGRSREQLFVTHKIFDIDARPVKEACQILLDASGLGYFDLLLMHAPCTRDGRAFQKPLPVAWQEMIDLQRAHPEKVRAIGVSNFRVADLETLPAPGPVCNQIEGHPYLQQPALMEYCAAHGITVTIYGGLSPITRGYMDLPEGAAFKAAVDSAAAAHNKTPAQVLLRWALQTGRVPITTTSKVPRMNEYLDVHAFALADAEVAAITRAGQGVRQQRGFWHVCKDYFPAEADQIMQGARL